ncbi:unnamed protein product [Closterium sp. NIES-64]|nr:unnamed protein product [Closterium sp. NIES-64]
MTTSPTVEFGHLVALEKLCLKCLPHLTHLHKSLGQLIVLRELKTVECRQLQQLPDSVSQLSSLEHLEIVKCPNIKVLPDDMGSGLRCLRHLLLLECTALTHLPPSFSGLTSLETLKIYFSSHFRGALLDGFGCLKSLKKLSLQHMARLSALPASFSGVINCPKIMVLPEGIGWLVALEVIKLGRMNGLKRLPPALLELLRLRVLEVRGCEGLVMVLGDENEHECTTGGYLPSNSNSSSSSSSALLPSLQRLKVRPACVAAGVPHLSAAAARVSRAADETLDIIDCFKLKQLPESFVNLSKLQSCTLVKVGISTIPDDFWKLASLQKLLILGLKLVRRLPDSFTQLPKLEELEVSACTQLTRLPSSLRKMAMLRVCNISECHLLFQRDMRGVRAGRGEEDGEEGDGEGEGRGDVEVEEGGGDDVVVEMEEEEDEAWEAEDTGWQAASALPVLRGGEKREVRADEALRDVDEHGEGKRDEGYVANVAFLPRRDESQQRLHCARHSALHPFRVLRFPPPAAIVAPSRPPFPRSTIPRVVVPHARPALPSAAAIVVLSLPLLGRNREASEAAP